MKTRDLRLDYIRVIAIWIILNFHFCTSYGLTSSPLFIMANGGWGCPGTTIFFVLSGFLLKAKYGEIKSIKDFYFKRFMSIYPTYYVAFIACYLVNVLISKNLFWAGNPFKLIYSILGVDNYMGFYGITAYATVGEWFTAVIILIYLLYPLLLWAYNKSKLLISIVIYGLYFLNVFIGFDPVIVDASFFSGLAMFYTGILLSDIKEVLDNKKILGVIGIIISVLLIFVKMPGPYVLYLHLTGIAMFIGLYMLFGFLNKYEKIGGKVTFLSTVSYAVYISHHFILNITTNKILPYVNESYKYVIVYVLYLIITIGVSIVLYYVTNKLTKIIFKK